MDVTDTETLESSDRVYWDNNIKDYRYDYKHQQNAGKYTPVESSYTSSKPELTSAYATSGQVLPHTPVTTIHETMAASVIHFMADMYGKYFQPSKVVNFTATYNYCGVSGHKELQCP